MAQSAVARKSMTIGEGGIGARLCGAGAPLAPRRGARPTRPNTRSMPICSRPPAPPRCSRSSTATSIVRRRLPAAHHRRQAELQHGAGQVRDRRRGVLGHRRLHGRPLGGARACLSGAQLRSAVALVRPHPAAAHLRGDLRLRRQRADRDLVLCRAAHLPRAARRRHRALVRRARLQLLHRHRRHRLSARHHPVEGIRRARVVRRPVAHRRVGRLLAGLPRHASCGATSRTSMWRTGSISPSSSPSRCCISATTPRSRCRCSRRSPTSSGPACRMRWCSGGTATTRSASSSPPASSPSCTTSSRSAPSGRSIPIGCRSSTSGR